MLLLVRIGAVVSSWEELESKREWVFQQCGLRHSSGGLGSGSRAFAGRFACNSHSVVEVVVGSGDGVVSITVVGVVVEVVDGGVAVSLAGVMGVGRLLGLVVVGEGGVVVGV